MQLLDSVNPLIPNLSMYILLTFFHIFLMVLDGRICLNIDSSSLVIISFIISRDLHVLSSDINWKEKLSAWHHLGLKG